MHELYTPRGLYDIEFERVKNNIKRDYPDNEDYGSIVIIRLRNSKTSLYISRNGNIQIVGEECEEAQYTIRNIIAMFKDQVDGISYNARAKTIKKVGRREYFSAIRRLPHDYNEENTHNKNSSFKDGRERDINEDAKSGDLSAIEVIREKCTQPITTRLGGILGKSVGVISSPQYFRLREEDEISTIQYSMQGKLQGSNGKGNV